METNTKSKILNITKKMFASQCQKRLSMRDLAEKTNISPSVIYHYFQDKDILLRQMFDHIQSDLEVKIRKIKPKKTAAAQLEQYILFQMNHAEDIVSTLKYYLMYRKSFNKQQGGYIPKQTYIHIKKILEHGNKNKEFNIKDTEAKAKIIAHAINGFIMEYYPQKPNSKEIKRILLSIHRLILKSLK